MVYFDKQPCLGEIESVLPSTFSNLLDTLNEIVEAHPTRAQLVFFFLSNSGLTDDDKKVRKEVLDQNREEIEILFNVKRINEIKQQSTIKNKVNSSFLNKAQGEIEGIENIIKG